MEIDSAAKKDLLTCFGLLLTVWAVFYPLAASDYVRFDDPGYVYNDALVAKGWTIPGIERALVGVHNAGWHPLTTLSHMTDVQLFGLSPGPHHAVNVLLHSFSVLLLYALGLALFASRPVALIVAALWAVHPLHVEPVAWISSRKDVLSTLFLLASMLVYTRYAARPSWRRYLALLACFACALMSKGTAVMLPILLLLLDYWPLKRIENLRDSWHRLLEKVPLLLLVPPVVLINAHAQSTAGGLRTVDQLPIRLRLENSVVSIMEYLYKTLVPFDLVPFYPFPHEGIPAAKVLGATVLLLLISLAALLLRRRIPGLLMGWLWFLFALSPVLTIFAVGNHSHADRFTYWPHVGSFLGLAGAVHQFRQAKISKLILALMLFLVLPLAAASAVQVRHWRNTVTLFTHAVSVLPESPAAQLMLGQGLRDSGRVEEALAHLESAVRLGPNVREAHNTLGTVYEALGRFEEARRAYEAELALNPEHGAAWSNLGNALFQLGKHAEALAAYNRAIEVQPNYADGYSNLGAALLLLNRPADALPHLKHAAKLSPHPAHFVNLGAALLALSRPQEALMQARRALALAPGDPRADSLRVQALAQGAQE